MERDSPLPTSGFSRRQGRASRNSDIEIHGGDVRVVRRGGARPEWAFFITSPVTCLGSVPLYARSAPPGPRSPLRCGSPAQFQRSFSADRLTETAQQAPGAYYLVPGTKRPWIVPLLDLYGETQSRTQLLHALTRRMLSQWPQTRVDASCPGCASHMRRHGSNGIRRGQAGQATAPLRRRYRQVWCRRLGSEFRASLPSLRPPFCG